MGFPKDFGSRAERPLQRKPPPSPREIFTGSNDDAMDPAQLAALRGGSEALGRAIAVQNRKDWTAYEAGKQAQAEAQKAADDLIWQDYLDRAGR
jgi:hypothetical protein